MAKSFASLEELIAQARAEFEEVFGGVAEIFGAAPGRVNLIGDHVDYNDGYVLPMTIPMYTVVVGRPNHGQTSRIYTSKSTSLTPNQVELKIDAVEVGPPQWSNYVKGVIANYPGEKRNFDCLIATSIPIGAGLSSSAALEVSFFKFLQALDPSNSTINNQQIALSCQKAEHLFAGTPCGIMDQYTSIFGRKGNALLIDCRSNTHELIPLDSNQVSILIINSHVKHELSGGEYGNRRKNCENVASMLAKSSLRDVSMKELETSVSVLTPEMYRYARHVITEIERTIGASEALRNKKSNDENLHFLKFGALMSQSHWSLRDDFNVSCPPINEIVEASIECEGVYGSRITGGGFGGFVVALVKSDKTASVIEHVKNRCKRDLDCYVVWPVDGAHNGRST